MNAVPRCKHIDNLRTKNLYNRSAGILFTSVAFLAYLRRKSLACLSSAPKDSNYITQSTASSTYLTQANATSTYALNNCPSFQGVSSFIGTINLGSLFSVPDIQIRGLPYYYQTPCGIWMIDNNQNWRPILSSIPNASQTTINPGGSSLVIPQQFYFSLNNQMRVIIYFQIMNLQFMILLTMEEQ